MCPPGHAAHPAVTALVNATMRRLPDLNGVKPTTLYATKRNVERENKEELEKLDRATEVRPSPPRRLPPAALPLAAPGYSPLAQHVYRANDRIGPDPDAPANFEPNPDPWLKLQDPWFTERCPAASEVKLRLGAQVFRGWSGRGARVAGHGLSAARRARR